MRTSTAIAVTAVASFLAGGAGATGLILHHAGTDWRTDTRLLDPDASGGVPTVEEMAAAATRAHARTLVQAAIRDAYRLGERPQYERSTRQLTIAGEPGGSVVQVGPLEHVLLSWTLEDLDSGVVHAIGRDRWESPEWTGRPISKRGVELNAAMDAASGELDAGAGSAALYGLVAQDVAEYAPDGWMNDPYVKAKLSALSYEEALRWRYRATALALPMAAARCVATLSGCDVGPRDGSRLGAGGES